MGPAQAAVTIVEFSDFQCPFCRLASADLHDLRRWYGNKVSVVYRNLPIHRFARSAAAAGECAARANAFERLHDAFFAQPDSIGKKPWSRFALESGIKDTAEFARCMNDSTTVRLLRRDSLAAVELGAHSTPTFLINDLMVVGNPGLTKLTDYFKQALAASER